jgi:protein-disulfide isomerase
MHRIVYKDRKQTMAHFKKSLGLALIGAAWLATASSAAPAKTNWLTTVTVTDKGAHVVGNPSAPNKVIEYLSYTCGHCAEFEAKEAPQFKAAYVATGKASLEIRNLLLNPIDLTAAMLARCGGKERFFGNQKHLFATQPVWLGKTKNISAATQAKLKSEDYAGFMTGVYTEIGLDKVMQQRGVTTVQGKACLADKASLNAVLEMTDAGSALGVSGTPSFLVNGKLQDHMHSFAELKAALK